MIQPEMVSQRIPRHWEQEAISGARILASLGLGYQQLACQAQVHSFFLGPTTLAGSEMDGGWHNCITLARYSTREV
ncbi:hypothetical protein CFAM422_003317 [Trichoderma lentiforme]|uniref:Uncharacterized protein n=1 Tax=Trichoderma lentiforme TaxID=1567552 RepID=A0A9P5CH20_9HYPO|nr:hypothetical protein CFAM422_003317 [Trichoderma lentiforme]